VGRLSEWLAPLMQDYGTVWCPRHLQPYQEQWPLGAPTATVYLVEAAAEETREPDGYGLLARLVELSPLCCWISRSTLRGIYGKTVPL